ncbi:hypothetical protein Sste5346_002698 [Sporothrix stenoceras]|uniref:RRM domain-containing protein n=1 Tax=Sporothrix stenoceras TaxID=5173 RepID=A0ABR3ZHZ2_9PEZI
MNFADLKLLSREVASVDKCFINAKTSEGWVRVRSQHDFFKVCHHLNGLDYQGYILSASADNSSRSVYIWDQKKSRSSTNPSSSSRRAGAPHLSPYSKAASTLDYGHYGPGNEGVSPAEYNACYSYDSGYCSGASSSSGYPYSAEPSTQTVTAMAPDFASSQQYEGADCNSGSSWYPHYSSGSGVDYGCDYGYDHPVDCATGHGVVPQTVKVVVKNLSRHASTNELESYLLSAVGGRNMLQEDVRFPRQTSTSSSSSSSRQHAFLLFKTHSDALMAVNKLDKTKLLGLVIEARLATEMLLPIRGSPSSTSFYVPPLDNRSTTSSGDVGTVTGAATSIYDDDGCSAASGHWDGSQTKREKSHNLVVDGKSIYGHVKKAVEETKARDRKHKHRK